MRAWFSCYILFAIPIYAQTVITGTLTITVADYFSEHRSETRYFVEDQSQPGFTVEIHSPSTPVANLRTGMLVTARGAEIRPTETARETPSTATSLPVTTPATGAQKTLVYILQSATTLNNFTSAELQNIMFAPSALSVNSFYQQNSFGSVSFEGDIVGPYTVTVPTTCDTMNIRSQAIATAAAAKIDTVSYTHWVFMMPVEMTHTCTFGGLSTVGGNPSSSWINTGFYFPTDTNIDMVLVHELGHALNMLHAQSIQADGSLMEYGDDSCPMGASYIVENFNVPHFIQEGWIPLSNILQVSTSGNYTVTAGETQTAAVQALQIIPQGGSDPLYVSYRRPQPDGIDANVPLGFTEGANIHFWNGGINKTRLATDVPWGGGLSDGQTFTTPDGTVSIRQVSHTAGDVTVSVTLSPLAAPITTPTIANSASGARGIAPDSLASIYGLNIAAAQTMIGSVPFPPNLGGVEVRVNGVSSPLLYVSPTQINFQIPPATQPGNADVAVYLNGQLATDLPQTSVGQRDVGIYTAPNPIAGYPGYLNALVVYYKNGVASPVYYTAALNSKVPGTFQLNTISLNPDLGQAFLSIYATGVNGQGGVPIVLINGLRVATTYSGPQGYDPGLDQINLQIPPDLYGIVTISIPGYDQQVVMELGI
jgi:uncharacterized protein (TIGR03437 family)